MSVTLQDAIAGSGTEFGSGSAGGPDTALTDRFCYACLPAFLATALGLQLCSRLMPGK